MVAHFSACGLPGLHGGRAYSSCCGRWLVVFPPPPIRMSSGRSRQVIPPDQLPAKDPSPFRQHPPHSRLHGAPWGGSLFEHPFSIETPRWTFRAFLFLCDWFLARRFAHLSPLRFHGVSTLFLRPIHTAWGAVPCWLGLSALMPLRIKHTKGFPLVISLFPFTRYLGLWQWTPWSRQLAFLFPLSTGIHSHLPWPYKKEDPKP